ncbi:hypothetical protein D3C84_1006670 [compost metagenome]
MVGEVRHLAFGGEGRGLRAGIGHRAQAGCGQVLEVLVVLASHDAGTDQGDTQWLGQGRFLLLLSMATGEARGAACGFRVRFALFRTWFYF